MLRVHWQCTGRKNISFNDYPLLKREDFYTKIALFMEKNSPMRIFANR